PRRTSVTPTARAVLRMRAAIGPDPSEAVLVEGKLAGADRHGEPILAGRQWAAPRVVVGAVRVIRAVEVELESAVAKRLSFDIAARAVALVPARGVAEWDKESIALRERDQADALAANV